MFEHREEYIDKDDRIGMILIFKVSDECLSEVIKQEISIKNASLRKKVRDYEIVFENENIGIYWSPEECDLIKVITDVIHTYTTEEFAKRYGLSDYFSLEIIDCADPNVKIVSKGGTLQGSMYKRFFQKDIEVELRDGIGYFEYFNNETMILEDFVDRFKGDMEASGLCLVAVFP